MDAKHRLGVTPIVIVIVVVVVIAVAGVGTYLFVFSGRGMSNGRATVSISSTLSSQSTSSVPGQQNYKGDFTYTAPIGPFGLNGGGGALQEWNSTQSASGSFTFSINPATYTGTGSGQGTITVATHGYCTGSTTLQYMFTVQAAYPPGENMTIAFNPPSPSNVTVQLTCQGSTQGFSQADNPVTYLSVYPNGLYLGAFPATVSEPLTNGISYTVTIAQTG